MLFKGVSSLLLNSYPYTYSLMVSDHCAQTAGGKPLLSSAQDMKQFQIWTVLA
jgi:hypothetical protein